MTPTKDDFDAWTQDPVTQWVRRICAEAAAKAKAEWQETAWSGSLDPVAYAQAFTRSEAYGDFAGLTYDQAMRFAQ